MAAVIHLHCEIGTMNHLSIARPANTLVRGIMLFCLLFIYFPGMAQAADDGTPREYQIGAGPLDRALNTFASEAGILLAIDGSLTAGKTTGGLSGRFTVSEGLARLLAGTGLQAVMTGDGSYTLQSVPAADAMTLPAVTVEGEGTAYPPGELTPVYAGGQVARGGRLGMLGNVDVMDTPFNITNYTSQLIADQQAETVLDVLKNEPSVRQIAPTGTLADASFNIRGFNLNPGAATFDGLQGMAPVVGNLSVEFAERVEVLKGPSALLYGMSPTGAVGGSVNLVPKRAGDTPLTRLTLGVESDALWKAQVDTGRRFGADNEWGLRFNGRYKDGDSFIDGAKNEGDLGALALDYRGERLRLSLDAYRLQEKQHGGGTLNAFLASGLTSVPAAPDARTNMYPGVPESRETTQAVILGGEYDFSDRWTGYAKLGAQRNEFEGPVNFGVQDIQANGDGDVIRDDAPSFARTKSAEIGLQGRFQIDAVSHALALSASYLNRDSGGGFTFASSSHPTNIYRPTPIVDYLVPVPADDLPKTSETTLSGFALADTLGFMNDRMLLTLGTRRQNVKATNFDDTTGAVTSTYDASAWTPMAGLVVKPTDDLSLYTSYIQGLSQGTTVGNGFQNAGEVFPPYKTEQIEVGAKLQTGSFTNTLSLFQIEQPSTLTDNGTTPLPTLRLNGEQRNRGIEWATFGELTRSLRMLGGVTYLQGTLTRTQDGLEDGNQAAGTPPWMANLGLDWDVPGLPDLAVNGRVTYTSAQYVDSANSFKLPSWTLLDLGARYATEMGGKPVVFRASVDNVFDRNYWQGVFFNGSDTLGAPRTFRLSAAVDF
jgi:iron complex outermembrane receptor protein